MKTAKDPHHNGFNTWGWDGTTLFIKNECQSKWTKVKRIHPTPARVAVLNKLMNGDENANKQQS